MKVSDLKTLLERADRAVADVPLPATGLGELERRRDRTRRNQRIAAGVVGIAVFVAAVWIVTSVGSSNRTVPAIPGPTGPKPTLPAGIGTETSLIDLNTGQMTPLPKSISDVYPQVSPDSTMVAYATPDDAGRWQLFIASLDGTDVQQVTHGRREARAPDWSPDGTALVYHASGQGDATNIFVLDLTTGETRQVTNYKPPFSADAPQFTPDGASIIYDLHREASIGLRVVPVTGGKSVPLVGGYKTHVTAASGTFSPDGSTLAMQCGSRLVICIADGQGNNLRELVNGSNLLNPRWSPDGTRIAYTDTASHPFKTFVVDVATGETTLVAEGLADDWLDDHTLVVTKEG